MRKRGRVKKRERGWERERTRDRKRERQKEIEVDRVKKEIRGEKRERKREILFVSIYIHETVSVYAPDWKCPLISVWIERVKERGIYRERKGDALKVSSEKLSRKSYLVYNHSKVSKL